MAEVPFELAHLVLHLTPFYLSVRRVPLTDLERHQTFCDAGKLSSEPKLSSGADNEYMDEFERAARRAKELEEFRKKAEAEAREKARGTRTTTWRACPRAGLELC